MLRGCKLLLFGEIEEYTVTEANKLRNLGEGTEENLWRIVFEYNYHGIMDKMMLTVTVKDCPEDLF